MPQRYRDDATGDTAVRGGDRADDGAEHEGGDSADGIDITDDIAEP